MRHPDHNDMPDQVDDAPTAGPQASAHTIRTETPSARRASAPPQTDAEIDSDTRFGRREVPKGHRRPSSKPEPRRTIPHGDVSPKGDRVWPTPSAPARWLAWGGAAIAAAAVTVGGFYAARQLTSMMGDDDEDPERPVRRRRRPSRAPRFAEMSPEQREWVRRRARREDAEKAYTDRLLREQAAQLADLDEVDDAPRRPRRRRKHPDPYHPSNQARGQRRRRKPRKAQGFFSEFQDNSNSLSSSLDNTMRSLSSALMGFRTVSGQAAGIMREFREAADLARSLLGNSPEPERPAPRKRRPARSQDTGGGTSRYPDRHGAHMPDLRDDPQLDDPTETARDTARRSGAPRDSDGLRRHRL